LLHGLSDFTDMGALGIAAQGELENADARNGCRRGEAVSGCRPGRERWRKRIDGLAGELRNAAR
jgi:hypothetical protein